METTRKSNKNFPFEGLNPLSVWSINDSMEQLLEIKKILQEKEKKKWLIFYITTIAMILTAYFLFKNVALVIIIPVTIVLFYLLYLQINKLKQLKNLELDLDSRIKQVEENESQVQFIPGNKNFSEIMNNSFRCKKCYPAVNQKILTGLSSDDKLEIWCDNCKTGVFLYLLENQKNNEHE